MLTLRAAALTAAIASVSAKNIPRPHQARETGAFVFPFDQITPWPTPAPQAPARLVAARADTSSTTTVLVGPDNICGYIDGRPGASLYCPAGANCVLFTAQATMSGAVACCNTDACNIRLTCMDRDQVVSSSLCDNGCMVDAFTLKCTDSLRPYCNTASFSSNIIDYWCNDVSISSEQTVLTAYDGQTNRNFSPLALDSSTTLDIPSSSVVSGPDPTDDPDDDDDDTDPTSTPTPTIQPKKKKVNAGAIAGGVVGGVAALGLIGLGVFFLLRKRKNDKATAGGAAGTAAAAIPPPGGHYPPNNQQPQMAYAQQPGQHPQSVYNPAYAQPGQQFTTTPPPQGWDPVNGAYYATGAQGGLTPVSPSRLDSTSPHDARASTVVTSPSLSSTSGFAPHQQGGQPYAPGQPQIHEAGGSAVGHHRGEMHELG